MGDTYNCFHGPSTLELKAKARELFAEYFRENYPGPSTIISNPDWHSPKIFAAAFSCLKEVGLLTPAPEGDAPGERERLLGALKDHWLFQIECHHEAKTDQSVCSCGLKSPEMPNVGAAVKWWGEHLHTRIRGVLPRQLSEEQVRSIYQRYNNGSFTNWPSITRELNATRAAAPAEGALKAANGDSAMRPATQSGLPQEGI